MGTPQACPNRSTSSIDRIYRLRWLFLWLVARYCLRVGDSSTLCGFEQWGERWRIGKLSVLQQQLRAGVRRTAFMSFAKSPNDAGCR